MAEETKYLPSEVAAAILSIPGGTDTSEDTVTANDLVAGITAHDNSGEQITGTMPNLDEIAFGELDAVPARGYTDGAWYETIAEAIKTRTEQGGSGGSSFEILVYIDEGSTVTATDGSKTYTGVWSAEDSAFVITVDGYGTYTVTATLGEDSATGTITVERDELTLGYAPAVTIVGNVWDWSNNSTALTRLTTATDPHGYVNTDITTEPVAAVGTGEGSSPFDELQPWAGMYECNHDGTAVTYKKGEEGFSRTANDTVIWTPEYYCKIINDVDNKKTYYYSASGEVDGFVKMEGSGKFIGRYKTGTGYVTKSGVAPQVNMTRATCRTQSKAKGGKWRMNDYATWCAYTFLYLMEFADWDSQTTLGKGYTSMSSAGTTGGTDSMTYHTGSAGDKTSGQYSVQYRGIEDPFGRVYEILDGINFNNRRAYVCTDPTKYADDTSTGYTDTGVTLPSSDGYINELTPSSTVAWAFFLPSKSGGSETTFISDYVFTGTGWRNLHVGGLWSGGLSTGLFGFYAADRAASADTYVGGRLLADSETEVTE